MKINWKALAAVAVMLVVTVWTVTSMRSTSYSGTNLNFIVGTGTVTMTNPSSDAIPVSLSGRSSRSFSVSSTIEDMPRGSTREGTAYLIEFELPSGVSEFTVTRGLDVKLIADTDTELEATVHAANNGTKIKVLAGVIIAGLAFISYTTEHHWIYKLLGREPASKLHYVPSTGEQNIDMRAPGDNRGTKMSKSQSDQ